MSDPITALAPTNERINQLWPVANQEALPTQFKTPKRRWPWLAAVAAALVVGLAVTPIMSSGPANVTTATAKALDELAAKLPADQVPKTGQFSHQIAKDHPSGEQVIRESWRDMDGWIWRKDTFPNRTAYYIFKPLRDEKALDKLPTDPIALEKALRGTVSGSNTQNEALFVFVGDTVSTANTSLALRKGSIQMLKRLPEVQVTNGKDPKGNERQIVSFVDEKNRPGCIHSLYFAAGNYRGEMTKCKDTPMPDGKKASMEYASVITTSDLAPLSQEMTAIVGTERVEKEIVKNR